MISDGVWNDLLTDLMILMDFRRKGREFNFFEYFANGFGGFADGFASGFYEFLMISLET